MSFERELLKRIPRYEADGLIDRAAAEKLSAHLRASLEGKKPVFFNAVYFAGAILLIVSSCLFVQNIWDELSAGMAAVACVCSACDIGDIRGFARCCCVCTRFCARPPPSPTFSRLARCFA